MTKKTAREIFKETYGAEAIGIEHSLLQNNDREYLPEPRLKQEREAIQHLILCIKTVNTPGSLNYFTPLSTKSRVQLYC